jgi:hypothetical protein
VGGCGTKFSFSLLKTIMASNNKTTRGGGGNPGNLTGEGSGQQTSGKREQRMNLPGKAPYQRDGERKKARGRRGGNR